MATSTNATSEGRARMLTGIFKNREDADLAYRAVLDRGYNRDEINLMMSEDTRKKFFAEHQTEIGNKALKGVGTGGAIGGTIGAILGAVAAAATLAIPGLNIVAAGPIIAALTGLGAGALTGGIIGALVGWGIPEEHAKAYEKGIKTGSIVIGVTPHTNEDAEYFEREWKKDHGELIYR